VLLEPEPLRKHWRPEGGDTTGVRTRNEAEREERAGKVVSVSDAPARGTCGNRGVREGAGHVGFRHERSGGVQNRPPASSGPGRATLLRLIDSEHTALHAKGQWEMYSELIPLS